MSHFSEVRDIIREASANFREWMYGDGRKAIEESRAWLWENAPRIRREFRETLDKIKQEGSSSWQKNKREI